MLLNQIYLWATFTRGEIPEVDGVAVAIPEQQLWGKTVLDHGGAAPLAGD